MINRYSYMFQKYLNLPDLAKYKAMEKIMGVTPFTVAHYILNFKEELIENSWAMNTATSFYLWYLTPPDRRKVIRVTPNTAKELAKINLGFIPKKAPTYWGGNAIVIESKNDTPLLDNVVSITAHLYEGSYCISGMLTDGAGISFNIPADTKINETLAKNQELLTNKHFPSLKITGVLPTKREQLQALAVLKFLFVTTYYTHAQKYLETSVTPGLPIKNQKGKVVKKKGQKQYLWRYVNIGEWKHPSYKNPKPNSAPLNKEHLTLSPSIVSGYVTERQGKVVIIDPYDSHRWKNLNKIGTKVTV